MASHARTPAPDAPTPWSRAAAVVALLTAAVSLVLTAFAWPAATSSLHDLPIGVAGTGPSAERVITALEEGQPGAFSITRLTDTRAARDAVQNRDVYGAIDLTTLRPEVIIGTAGSPMAAQTLQTLAQNLTQAKGTATPATVTVHDLAPLSADDPRGAGLAAAGLPLVMGGMLGAVLLGRMVEGTGRQVTAMLAYAVTGGLALTAILQFGFGSLGGAYLANSGVVALAISAIALTLMGLQALLGGAGLGLGAALMMLIGNPLSGTSSAPEMLPGWTGELGRLLPPGAAGTLLRSTAFYDGGGATGPLIVMLTWLAIGAALLSAAVLKPLLRSRRRLEEIELLA
ncbi:hypothetical protein EDD29_4368 [Actinocorallia herbida]|uniref:ABC transporter permease n=1 Tax=Actinocorallia herbida TaxID=58109 RepID=A0A3N1D139_9ACTN|nr:hypothetical protein [Actinocorallia herbida]ROO86788.1 hypothetical protein EDD29_4368 [Actinocorallia herbida]